MSRKPSKPETRIEDYLDVMTGGNAALPQPILRIEFYYAFLAGMTVELPQPILDDEKLLAKICGMDVEAPTYIPGLYPRLYAYMAKKGGQDVQVPDPILRLECYWYDYSAGEAPSVQEYTGAVPVTFIAGGTPLLDYIITGNTVQSGTPTPDNPIMPEGTGERTGNLFDANRLPSDTWTIDDKYYIDGAVGDNKSSIRPDTVDVSISNSGDLTVTARSYYGAGFVIPVTPNTTYTISFTTDMAVPSSKSIATITYVNADEDFLNYITIYGDTTSVTFTTPNTAYYILITFRYASNTITYLDIMLSSTALPYEPYGYKIPISSANTTTPVYLGEVETTRKVKKYVCTGDESWSVTSGQGKTRAVANFTTSMGIEPLSKVLSTHYIGAEGGASFPNINTITVNNNGTMIIGISSEFTNSEAWKSYLAQQYAAGTPVTVWYVLANETTAVVNEPLMRIGDYTDTLSMEQAGVQIPTANGSTTLDVETTVKPSEVYIKYRGEAVTTLSSLPAEVSSPEAATEEVNPEETEEEENER